MEKVEKFLSEIGQDKFFVRFLTQKGEQREYVGNLVPSSDGYKKEFIPIKTESGFKSFKVSSVEEIRRV